MADSLPRNVDDDVDRPPLPGDVIAGKYEVESVVGSGGMGIVVAARHLTLGQTVAVKLLRVAGLDEARRTEACARFLREGQSAARLTSEHVVRIHDVGTLDDGAPFMVMELLRGSDLSSIVEGQGGLAIDLAVEFVIQASDAVGEAHARGIVHRDLKPSNLFVSTRSDGRPLVKVLDFGISKALSADDPLQGNLTSTRTVVGSPYYMSPEQVRDSKRVDARSDICSLGMILYELLVGEPAFNAETLPGICAAIAADPPPPIRERRPEVPPELEAVVMRCLEKDPARRFQTVAELLKALAPFGGRIQGVSAADYASRRLEDSAMEAARGRRARPDAETVQSAHDSGFHPAGAIRTPSMEPEVVSAGLPAVLNPGEAARPAPAPQSTLVSASGSTLQPSTDPIGNGATERVPPPVDSTRGRRSFLVAVLLLVLGGGVTFVFLPRTPPAGTPEVLPLGHEPVGPAPVAAPVAPPPPKAPAPAAPEPASAEPAASAAAAVAAPVAAHAKASPKPAPRPVHPKAAAPSATTPADIRLER